MQVYSSLVGIHAVVVVHDKLVGVVHAHLQDVVESRYRDTELNAVAVHIVISRDVEKVVGLVVVTARKQTFAIFIGLVESVVACCHVVADIFFSPRRGVFKLPLAVGSHLPLSDAPVVAVDRKRLVCADHDVVFGYAHHLARQRAVSDSDLSADGWPLHIFDCQIYCVGVFALNVVYRRVALVDCDVGDVVHLFILFVGSVVGEQALNLHKLFGLRLVVGVVGIEVARFHQLVARLGLLVEFTCVGVYRLVVGLTDIFLVGWRLQHERCHTLSAEVLVEVVGLNVVCVVDHVHQTERNLGILLQPRRQRVVEKGGFVVALFSHRQQCGKAFRRLVGIVDGGCA